VKTKQKIKKELIAGGCIALFLVTVIMIFLLVLRFSQETYIEFGPEARIIQIGTYEEMIGEILEADFTISDEARYMMRVTQIQARYRQIYVHGATTAAEGLTPNHNSTALGTRTGDIILLHRTNGEMWLYFDLGPGEWSGRQYYRFRLLTNQRFTRN